MLSPTATGSVVAADRRAWPSMSSDSSGSSSQPMSSGSSSRARRIASSTRNAWLASVKISNPPPTASRTAYSRATSSPGFGLPTFTLQPRNPRACAASASSTSAAVSICSQPPSVV